MVEARPKPRRMSVKERAAADRAAAFAALAKYAAKESDRELLRPGDEVTIDLEVRGQVSGRRFAEAICGALQVGHDQTAATSSAPDLPHLVAFLLELLPRTRLRQVLDELPAHYLKEKALPDVAPETYSAAETLLERLRDRQTITKKGNVRFEPASA